MADKAKIKTTRYKKRLQREGANLGNFQICGFDYEQFAVLAKK